MTFQWSKNAWHIQSVFPPWQEQDGYALPILVAAEQSLGIPLPMLLKNFYHAWGRRTDLTRARETLLNPDQLTVRSGGFDLYRGEPGCICVGNSLYGASEE